jgi:hypothetical protein
MDDPALCEEGLAPRKRDDQLDGTLQIKPFEAVWYEEVRYEDGGTRRTDIAHFPDVQEALALVHQLDLDRFVRMRSDPVAADSLLHEHQFSFSRGSKLKRQLS